MDKAIDETFDCMDKVLPCGGAIINIGGGLKRFPTHLLVRGNSEAARVNLIRSM